MYTTIYVILELVLYITISYMFFKILKKKRALIFFFLSFLFLVSLWLVAEFLNRIDIFLSEKNILIELGHASILNIEIWLLFNIIALIIIVRFLLKKRFSDK